MQLRNLGERERSLDFDQSIRNELFLQTNAVVKAAKTFFDSLPKTGLTIYDFGCGTKPYKIFAGKNRYIGIDIDESNIQADLFANIENVPEKDAVADVVCSFCVLEHVFNPQAVLSEKWRLLRKGGEGQLFMLVPLYWEEHEQPYDFWRFTKYSLDKMLSDCGFKNIEITALNSTWSIIGLNMVRFLSRKWLLRLTVPCFNQLFSALDQRSLRRHSQHGNVMTYAVQATT